jgi:hypothetical protein
MTHDELEHDELEGQEPGLLPDREAMSSGTGMEAAGSTSGEESVTSENRSEQSSSTDTAYAES